MNKENIINEMYHVGDTVLILQKELKIILKSYFVLDQIDNYKCKY